ncbi:MAG: S41 family peptidase, partial [Oscillospiraceae bacterium]|nr:S41 family peptidase [Oscillospiraceae bacterium]
YYTKDEMTQFTQHSAGVFHGVGVYVTQGENGRLRITGFLENSPAQEAGVEIDDEIISVDGEDVTGITDSNIVINMIKGEAGVFVTIGFYRPSDGTAPEFAIERREIKTDNIFSHIVYTGEDGESGMPVGYIYIKMFDGAANEYFNRHLDRLLEQGVEALVIDLRGNPGGDYEETVKIADRLIGEGIIVYTEDRAGRREYRESGEGALDMPIRVLIDGDTASSSEILAGAIKDSGAGRLVGATTYGKGLVQAVMRLSDGSGLKYTRSRYFTPSGVCIDGTGIEPDIYVGPGAAAASAGASGGAGEGAGEGTGEGAGSGSRGYDLPLETALLDIENFIDKALYE